MLRIVYYSSVIILLVSRSNGQNIYFGDLHTHSSLSFDAKGDIDTLYRFAIDSSKIDFVCFSDHDVSSTDDIWIKAKEKANQYYTPGSFVAFIGYEWTKFNGDGHRVVLYPGNDAIRYSSSVTTLTGLYSQVKNAGGQISVCHPDDSLYYANMNVRDQDIQNHIEIFGGAKQTRFEYYGNPNAAHNQKKGFSVQDWLALNEPFGFRACSDSHIGKPGKGGLTAVIANALTRESIFDALQHRRTYATTGERVKLTFTSSKGVMGDDIEFGKTFDETFNYTLWGGSKISLVEIISDGKVIAHWNFNDATVMGSFIVEINSNSYYYIRATTENNHVVWSTPIYYSLLKPETVQDDSINALVDKVEVLYNSIYSSTQIHYQFSRMPKKEVCFRVYDILGKRLREQYKSITTNKGIVDLQIYSMPSGVYYVQSLVDDKYFVNKLLIMK